MVCVRFIVLCFSKEFERSGVQKATVAVRGLFSDEEIPEDFTYQGQTFEERCEAWVLHAVGQLQDEITTFKDERAEDGGEEEEADEDEE